MRAESVEMRARQITEHYRGHWNEARNQGRHASCPCCAEMTLDVGVGKSGCVAFTCWSTGCQADKEKARSEIISRLTRAGFRLDPDPKPAPFSVRRPVSKRLPKATEAQIALMKPAHRRLLEWLTRMAKGRAWVSVSRRTAVANCGISSRDVVPYLRAIAADRGLIEVQANGYRLKRITKLRFTVDPIDLGERLNRTGTAMDRELSRNEAKSCSPNGLQGDQAAEGKMKPVASKNEATMERAPTTYYDSYKEGDDREPEPSHVVDVGALDDGRSRARRGGASLTVEPHAGPSGARRLAVTSELRRHLAKIEAANRRDRQQSVDDHVRRSDVGSVAERIEWDRRRFGGRRRRLR